MKFTRGLKCIDEKLGLIEINELVLFGGYSGIGKTEYMYYLARKNAEKGNNVLYLNIELSENVMLERTAKKKAGITKYQYQIQDYSEEQYKIYKEELRKLRDIDVLKLNIHNYNKNPDMGIIEKTIRIGYDKGYRLFIIDNLGCISGALNENERFEYISRNLQQIKNDLGISIILVHHLRKPKDNMKYQPGGGGAFRGTQKVVDNSTQVIEIWRDLDPENTDEEMKKHVKILQYKDTIGGNQGYIDIIFDKGEYYEYIEDKLF